MTPILGHISKPIYNVSTVGADEEMIANYIRGQEDEDKRLDQLTLLTEE